MIHSVDFLIFVTKLSINWNVLFVCWCFCMFSWSRLRARVRLLSRESFRRRLSSWELRSVTWTLRSVEQRNNWLHKVSPSHAVRPWYLIRPHHRRQKASSLLLFVLLPSLNNILSDLPQQSFLLFTNRAVHQPHLGPGGGQPAKRTAKRNNALLCPFSPANHHISCFSISKHSYPQRFAVFSDIFPCWGALVPVQTTSIEILLLPVRLQRSVWACVHVVCYIKWLHLCLLQELSHFSMFACSLT